MRYLALDIGIRRTGVAYADDATKIPLPLATITHASMDALRADVTRIMSERRIDHLIVGLPLLPDGSEGAQAQIVRSAITPLKKSGIRVTWIDERYSTPRKPKNGSGKRENRTLGEDPDAAAACEILRTFLAIDNGKNM